MDQAKAKASRVSITGQKMAGWRVLIDRPSAATDRQVSASKWQRKKKGSFLAASTAGPREIEPERAKFSF